MKPSTVVTIVANLCSGIAPIDALKHSHSHSHSHSVAINASGTPLVRKCAGKWTASTVRHLAVVCLRSAGMRQRSAVKLKQSGCGRRRRLKRVSMHDWPTRARRGETGTSPSRDDVGSIKPPCSQGYFLDSVPAINFWTVSLSTECY